MANNGHCKRWTSAGLNMNTKCEIHLLEQLTEYKVDQKNTHWYW